LQVKDSLSVEQTAKNRDRGIRLGARGAGFSNQTSQVWVEHELTRGRLRVIARAIAGIATGRSAEKNQP